MEISRDIQVMFRERNRAVQPSAEFLAGCGITSDTHAARIALVIRKAVGNNASPARDAESVFATHRIETDLGMYHMDSLDLVDMSLSIESSLGITLDLARQTQIFDKQKENCTVADLVALLLGFTDNEGTSQSFVRHE
jgi:acyl carrier protein